MIRAIKNYVHNECTGSWFGFPNPRYMSAGEWRTEMAFALFMYSLAFLIAGLAAIVISLFTIGPAAVAVAVILFSISAGMGFVSLFFPL